MIKGSVDIVDPAAVHGWAFAADLSGPVLVQAVMNHEILGEEMAELYREDLAAAGLGSGHCGFVIKLRRPLDPIHLPFLAVKVKGGDAELPRSGAFGFAPFLAAAGAAHPAAGRSRTMLGGLWTDRTDAAAMLRGKLRIGQVDAALAPALRQLIEDGVATVGLPQAPSAAAWRASPPGQLATLLGADGLAGVLRAVLEDNVAVLRTEWLQREAGYSQPSHRNPTAAPAECLEILLSFGEGNVLEAVRGSHALPEFSETGRSRYAGDGASAASVATVESHDMPPLAALVVAPGTIARVSAPAQALRLLAVPARNRAAGEELVHRPARSLAG